MQKALGLLFNLHPGEGRKAALFLLLGLLWSIGSYGSFVLSEGMFLEHIGVSGLPRMYFAIAVAMCLFSAALIFALNRASICSLLVSVILLWILISFTFFLLYPFLRTTTSYWYAYKAVGWMMPISTYIVYWAFVDQYYDLQDGKRFFCLFNAVTFFGDALGGALIAYGLDFLGTRGLLLLFIFSMSVSLFFIFLIKQQHNPIVEEHPEVSSKSASHEFTSTLYAVFQSKFTLYLLCFYFLMQLLAVVTEFNYMQGFEKAFETTPANRLTEFNGRIGMWISLGNMLFGMLAYSRLVKKLGINNIIVIAPFLFFAIYAFWFFKEALAIAIFGMIAREGIVYSFDDNNLNLLITGVPTRVRNQVRIVVESFIEPSGMFAAASLLFLFQGKAGWLGLTLSLVALCIVCFLRSSYPRAIFQNLVANSLRFDKKAKDYLLRFSKKKIKQAEFALLSHLKFSGEQGQLIAFECLLKLGSPHHLPRLLNHMGRLSLPGKLKTIELLSQSNWATAPLVLERLERWRSLLPHPSLKNAIQLYLARHGFLRPEKTIQDLHSEQLEIRAAAILSYKLSANAFQFPSLYALASEKLRLLLESTQEKEVCLALEILGLEKNGANLGQLLRFLNHSSLSICRAAGKALSLAAHPDCHSFTASIIASLSHIQDSEVRIYCLQALNKIADPQAVHPLILTAANLRPQEQSCVEQVVLNVRCEKSSLVPLLISLVQKVSIQSKSRLLAGKILGKIDRKALQKRLMAVTKKEIERAYFYYYHAHTIQKQVPEYDLIILQKALMTSFHSIIDFVIQLLGSAGALEESEILSHTLHSHNRKLRAQAIESLQKACDFRLFALLEPLIDERSVEEKMRYYLKNGGLPLNLTQLLDALAHSSSRADQVISLAMKARLQTPDWRTHLHKKLESNEKIFHAFAAELLEGQHA